MPEKKSTASDPKKVGASRGSSRGSSSKGSQGSKGGNVRKRSSKGKDKKRSTVTVKYVPEVKGQGEGEDGAATENAEGEDTALDPDPSIQDNRVSLSRLSMKKKRSTVEEGGYAYRFYSKEAGAGPDILAALKKFFPWPPKGNIFFSSGYYQDMALGVGGGKSGDGVSPDEAWVMDLDEDTGEDTIKKMFPKARKKVLTKGGNGLPMAVLKYSKPEIRNKEFESSELKKLGQGVMHWVFPNELKVENLPDDITEDVLTSKYPNAVHVKMRRGQAIIQFKSVDEAHEEAKHNTDGVIDLGDGRFAWIISEENYILKTTPSVTKADIQDAVPGTEYVKWLTTFEGNRVAVSVHADRAGREKAYADSLLPKQGPQQLEWQKGVRSAPKPAPAPAPAEAPLSKKGASTDSTAGPGKKPSGGPAGKPKPKSHQTNDKEVAGHDIHEMTPEELATKLWNKILKENEVGYSNISNLFLPKIYLLRCPKSMTRTKLFQLFKGAIQVDIQHGIGIIEYNTPLEAARGYQNGSKIEYEGGSLNITIHEPPILALTGRASVSKANK